MPPKAKPTVRELLHTAADTLETGNAPDAHTPGVGRAIAHIRAALAHLEPPPGTDLSMIAPPETE